jgi:4-hydroxybenzoate polyprenyltransferase
MVNPLWLWRGLKGYSVTFATLFASVLLGASIAGGFQKLLASLGVHWLYVILIPVFLFSWLAKKEPQWLPDEAKRKVWARSLIGGSIVLAIIINQIKH